MSTASPSAARHITPRRHIVAEPALSLDEITRRAAQRSRWKIEQVLQRSGDLDAGTAVVQVSGSPDPQTVAWTNTQHLWWYDLAADAPSAADATSRRLAAKVTPMHLGQFRDAYRMHLVACVMS